VHNTVKDGIGEERKQIGWMRDSADLVIDTDEKKLIFYQVGAVYERELSGASGYPYAISWQ